MVRAGLPLLGASRGDERRRCRGRGELAVPGHPASAADRATAASCGQGESPVSRNLWPGACRQRGLLGGGGRVPAETWGVGLACCRPWHRGGTSRGSGRSRDSAAWPAPGVHSRSCLPSARCQGPGATSGHFVPGPPCSVTLSRWFPLGPFSQVLCLPPPPLPLAAETSSRHSPRPLRVPPTKLARWTGRCGQHLSGGWVQR